MKKMALYVMVIVLLLGVSAGCGASQTGTGEAGGTAPQKSDTPSAKPITIKIWNLNNKEQEKAIFEEYSQKNPNVKIEYTDYGTDAYKAGLKVAASGGNAPDLWFNWGGDFSSFYAENNYSEDLTAYSKKYGWDQSLLPTAIQLGTYKAKLITVPKQIKMLGVIYRKDIFQKYNLQPPKTYDELMKINETLKSNGITPMSLGGKFGWHTMRLLDALLEIKGGAEYHTKLNSFDNSWNSPPVIESYTELKKWVDNGYMPKGFLATDPAESKLLMYKGQAAMTIEHQGFEITLKKDQQDAKNYGFFPLPTGNGVVAAFIDGWQINAKSPVKDEAAKLIDYYVSKDTMTKHIATLGNTATKGIIPDEKEAPMANQVNKLLETSKTYMLTDQALNAEMAQNFFQFQDGVVGGNMTPAQAAAGMQAAVDKYKAGQKK